MSALDIPNQLVALGDSVYDTFQHFWKTKECDIGFSLLVLLDKVLKGKNELRDLNSKLKHHINNLRFSRCSLKETEALNFYSFRTG